MVSDTQINDCIIPAGVALGSYNVKVYTGGGFNTTSAVKLNVVSSPSVTGVTPNTGTVSSPLTLNISGAGYFGGGGTSDVQWVRIKNTDGYTTYLTPPSASVITDTTINGAVMPAGVHAGTYDVQVNTSTGGSNGTSLVKITITTSVAPVVSGLTPSSGNNFFEKTTIGITGSGFFGGTLTDDVRSVILTGTSPVTSIAIAKGTAVSDSSVINCVVPSGIAVGTYDVILRTGSPVSATSAVQYVVTSAPVVTNVSPNTGSNKTQATGITIFGNHFKVTTAVNLSGPQNVYLPSWSISIDADQRIFDVTIPDGILAGTYDVRVSTSLGTNVTSAVKWIATTNPPAISGIAPNQGSNASSTTISITGTGFYGGTFSTPNISKISMYDGGGNLYTTLGAYTVNSDTLLNVIVPASVLLVGTYDVKLTNGGGESTGSVKFMATTPQPTIALLVPDNGRNDAPSTVTITGTGFYAGTNPSITTTKVLGVSLGGTALTGFSYVSGFDDLTCSVSLTIPSGLTTGRYPVSVTTSGGTSTINKNFDVTFDCTVPYGFTTSGVSFTIPANTFASDLALVVSTTAADTAKVTSANGRKHKNMTIRPDLNFTVREIYTGTGVVSTANSIGIRFSYASANINDSVVENSLRVAVLNTATGLWEFVPGVQSVDLTAKEVLCNLTHFSTYRLVQYVVTANTLDGTVVYPNPVSFDTAASGLIKFVNLTDNPALRIYTISGELVKEIRPNDTGNAGNNGKIEWDGKNQNGEVVVRGLYIYLITDEAGGRKVGKFAVK